MRESSTKSRSPLRSFAVCLCALVLAGCTTKDPLYCDKDHPCGPGLRCDDRLRSCQPQPGDGGVDQEGGGSGDATPAPNGTVCSSSAECQSGFCVDHACCDSACAGSCRTCAEEGRRGQCTLVGAGPDPHALCTGHGTTCGGTCDGQGACIYPDSTTTCGTDGCVDGKLTSSQCDGKGGCAQEGVTCGGYACADSTKCMVECSGAADCTGTFQCVGKQCVNQLGPGEPCGTNNLACASGHCVDGVCCASGPCDPCHACNTPAKLGQCSPLADGRVCGDPTCADYTLVTRTCKAGVCATDSASCAPYSCNAATGNCFTACAGDASCADTAYCESTVCQPKKPNGVSCAGTSECLSGICTATEKVCCDSACGAECETCAGKASCSPKPLATPCGTKTPFCDDQPTTSAVKTEQCDGNSSCVPVSLSACSPYRCVTASGVPSCATSCATNAACTTGVCDTFDPSSTKPCAPASIVCFADVKTCPATGAGTQASPYCMIQSCLDEPAPRAFLAIADGTYSENLNVKSSVKLISTGTQGPLWNGAYQAKVFLDPKGVNTAGVSVKGAYVVALYGIDLSHAPPSTPPKTTDPSGSLVDLSSGANLNAKTCHIHRVNSTSCIRAVNAKQLRMEDSVLELCRDVAIRAEVTDIDLETVGIYSSGMAIEQDTGSLRMRDTVLRLNLGGIHTYVSQLDLDRVRLVENLGVAMLLENNTFGRVTNLLAYGNWGSAVKLVYLPSKRPSFVNVTLVRNGGVEVDCGTAGTATTFANSIVWDDDTAITAGACAFWHSDVKGIVPDSTNINQDPLFDTGGAEPYSLKATSPCIDQGDDAPAWILAMPGLDLGKNKRKVDRVPGGPQIDMGAFEVQ